MPSRDWVAPVGVVAAFVAVLLVMAASTLRAGEEEEKEKEGRRPYSWWAEPGLYQHLVSIDAGRDDIRLVQQLRHANRTICPPIAWLPDACFKDFGGSWRIGGAQVGLFAHTGMHPHFGVDAWSRGNVSQEDRVLLLEAWFGALRLPEAEKAAAVAALRGEGGGPWKAWAGLDATSWDLGAWIAAQGGLGAARVDPECRMGVTTFVWGGKGTSMEGWLPHAEVQTEAGRLMATPLGDAMFKPRGGAGSCTRAGQAPPEARALYEGLGFRPLLG